MQTKKDYIQKAILQAATDEFFEHGYQKASMRKMAERAGTRMSNFYNYFKSKEELFTYIVNDTYHSMQQIIRSMAQSDQKFNFRNITDIKVLSEELTQWLQVFKPLFTKNTILLLDCAQGTKFENVKEDLIQHLIIIAGKLCNGIPDRLSKGKYPLQTFLTQMVDDIIQTVRIHAHDPNLKEIVYHQIGTFVTGIFVMTY